MKTSMFVAAVTLAVLTAAAASGQSAPGGPQVGAGPKCLTLYDITGSTALDSQAIVFRMKDGSAWKNTLPRSCSGLKFHGFEFVSADQKLCANMQSIRVIETRQTCLLGNFTPYTPASVHPAP